MMHPHARHGAVYEFVYTHTRVTLTTLTTLHPPQASLTAPP